jgi:tripartite-type tricarboxylate transporter receptor subunit TctC
LFVFITETISADAQEPFYKGATIRFIVGLSAGGGYDLYSRTIARHMGKHIPGNPTIVVENMVGAGSVLSANYLYRAAEPDGLTILNFLDGLFLQQLMGIRASNLIHVNSSTGCCLAGIVKISSGACQSSSGIRLYQK